MRAARVRPDVELAYRVSGQEPVGTPRMFRAPLARDLLGKQVGDTAVIQGPGGKTTVHIDAIEKIV